MFNFIWETVIKAPIVFTLTFFTDHTGNIGLSIILLTIVIQLILTPLRLPSLHSARKIRKLKPHLDDLKEKHKDDNTALAQAQLNLYKEHGVNPFGGILPTLLSIPIIIALYRVLLTTLNNGGDFATQFLWIDVTKPDPLYILPVLVFIAQYIQTQHTLGVQQSSSTSEKKEKTSQEDMMTSMQSQMKYVFPVISAVITATLPAGVGLYWFVSVLFAIIQHQIVERTSQDDDAATSVTSNT